MKVALRTKGARAPHLQTKTLPAPIGGWNARDSLADMPETDAIELVNIFPNTSTCTVRGGALGPRTTGSDPYTLMVYNGLDGSTQLFAASGGGIWDIPEFANVTGGSNSVIHDSAGNNYNAPFGTHSNDFIWTMFGDGTNNYLIAVNGIDNPLYYWNERHATVFKKFVVIDGSSSPALSGTTLSNLDYVNVYKGRLFFLQKNSLSCWYLAAGAAGGALTEFNLSAEAKRGGYLVAMANWTRDAGDGQDDVAVFLTSEGEAIVYQGNNPAVAANWNKVGTFFIGRPISRRCVIQYGADLLVLTETGIFPLSSAMQTAQLSNQYAISFKIEKSFTAAARLYGTNRGWKMLHFPRENALLVNIPIRPGFEHEQYVMNTITKAWCKFTHWNAEDFAVANGRLYYSQQFGTGGNVVEAWVGGHDTFDTEWFVSNYATYGHMRPIDYLARQAFTDCGARTRQKKFALLRPILQLGGLRTYQVGLDMDFQQNAIQGTLTSHSMQARWGYARWDISRWPNEPDIARDFVTVSQYPGLMASVKLSGSYVDQPKRDASVDSEVNVSPGIEWIATDLAWEPGGLL